MHKYIQMIWYAYNCTCEIFYAIYTSFLYTIWRYIGNIMTPSLYNFPTGNMESVRDAQMCGKLPDSHQPLLPLMMAFCRSYHSCWWHSSVRKTYHSLHCLICSFIPHISEDIDTLGCNLLWSHLHLHSQFSHWVQDIAAIIYFAQGLDSESPLKLASCVFWQDLVCLAQTLSISWCLHNFLHW